MQILGLLLLAALLGGREAVKKVAGLFVLAALLVPVDAAAVRRFALVVGSNAGDRSEVVLRYAESDAERIARILRDVGGFDPSDVLLLTQVDAENVRRALIGLNARVRDAGREAVLFVFYSGHGDAESLHLAGSRLDMNELRDLVSGSPAKARVLVVDSCRSGAITRIKGGSAGPSFKIDFDDGGHAEGVAILTSSAAGEDSQESDQLGASIFTHYLASAMLGAADKNHDGNVTLAEAFAYASERTLVASASTLAGPQHPTYRYDLGGRDEIALTRPGLAGRRVGLLAFPAAGSYLVSQGDADGAVVAEVASDRGGSRIALRPGTYFVSKRAPDHLLQGEVRVAEATTTQVDTGDLRRIDYARVVRKGGTERGAAWSTFALAGYRAPLLDLGGAFYTGVGSRIDLPFVSVEARVAMARSSADNVRLEIGTRELTGSLVGYRAFDLGLLTLAAGIEGGGTWIEQTFGERQTPDRSTYGGLLGPVGLVEVPLGYRLHLRAEGAALTYFLPVGDELGGGTVDTPVLWRGGWDWGSSYDAADGFARRGGGGLWRPGGEWKLSR